MITKDGVEARLYSRTLFTGEAWNEMHYREDAAGRVAFGLLEEIHQMRNEEDVDSNIPF